MEKETGLEGTGLTMQCQPALKGSPVRSSPSPSLPHREGFEDLHQRGQEEERETLASQMQAGCSPGAGPAVGRKEPG